MSAELTKARQLLSQVRTNIKTNKLYLATQAYYDAVLIVLKANLLKAEREEFERLMEEASYAMDNSKELTKACGIQVNYTKGQERELLDNLKMILDSLNQGIAEDAKSAIIVKEKRKKELLQQIEEKIVEGNLEEANRITLILVGEFGNNPTAHAEIGKLYFKYNIYKTAAEYMASALEANPNFTELYNDIGIALRRTKNFVDAEKYYLKASKYIPTDSHLFFNLGRVYIDAKDWHKAIQAANGALRLDPNFKEAQKMLFYAKKMLDTPSETPDFLDQ